MCLVHCQTIVLAQPCQKTKGYISVHEVTLLGIYYHCKIASSMQAIAISPVYTGPQTGSGLESGLRPRNAGGPGDPDHDLDQLRLHGAESGKGSRKVVSCKRGYRLAYRLRVRSL